MKKVRWGLLSTAHINRRLIPVIRNSPRGELTAIASRSIEQARSYAQDWDIPKIFGSYQEMLSSGSVDVVYISLPNHLHAEWSIRAMEAGVHVLCEKPFALTLKEVDQMIQASQKYNRHIAEAFMYRHHPQTKIAGEWVHSGKLGEITMVRGVFTFTLQNRDNVRLVPEFGGGSLWDVGVYPMSFSQFIFGCPPLRVSGMQYLGPSGVDESFSGQMEFPGEGIAQISSSLISPFNAHFEILGTTGRLELNRPFIGMDSQRKLVFHPDQGEPEEIGVPKMELYSGEVEDMHDAVLLGKPNYLRLDETRNHIRTVLALYESARSNRIVYL